MRREGKNERGGNRYKRPIKIIFMDYYKLNKILSYFKTFENPTFFSMDLAPAELEKKSGSGSGSDLKSK